MAPNPLFDQVFSELGPEFKKLIERKVQKYDPALSTGEDEDEEPEEMLDAYDIEKYLGEVGVPICAGEGGKLHLDERVSEPCVGAGCRIGKSCKVGHKVGSFHTHPLVGVWPSFNDINTSESEREIIFCIGGRLVDDKPYVACYIPTGRSFVNSYFSLDPIYSFSEEPEGHVRFYRESPPPDVEDLLMEMSNEDLASEYSDQYEVEGETEEEIGAKIRTLIEESGEMPEGFWDFYENEGEMDTLDIYSPEQGERLMEEAFARLAMFFKTEGRYI
jgi:hypothetical protein